MKSKKELIDHLAKGNHAEYVFFWSHRPKAKVDKSCLSQWYVSPFELDGIVYKTAEHFMMAEKARLFGDTEILPEVIAAKHPSDVKMLGRRIRGFDDRLWKTHRFDIVVRGNTAKFGQNESLKDFLLSTGDRVLVEASPKDGIWGIGLAENDPDSRNPYKWRGLNLLGFALMETRKRIRRDA